MKNLFILTILLISGLPAFSQCPNTTGNYEFSISYDARNITISARNTTATIRSNYVDPSINGNFVGLVFGIKWHLKSKIALYQNVSQSPFDIMQSGEIVQKDNYLFQSYGDASEKLPLLTKDFMNGEWHTIAIIPYTGVLYDGDVFELTECGFDESTNPYFAQMDNDGNYGQFTPNIYRVAGNLNAINVQNAVIVYPNPTMGDLFVDVSSVAKSKGTFTVLDMTGKILTMIQADLWRGLNKITINVRDLPNGMYLIKVTDGYALNFSQSFLKH